MLTFDEKVNIIEKFPQLERKNVSLGRVNFQLKNSLSDKKNIVYHLHPNGNGYVYAGHLSNIPVDDKGMVNIRDFSAEELRDLINEAIIGLSPDEDQGKEHQLKDKRIEEHWKNANNEELILLYENEAWNLYFGLNLDATFDSYKEAEEFLLEEGFHRS
jgi:hypothetical protein